MDISALLVYICVQGITPGPSNFMSLYTATTLGYRGARGYRIGTVTGFAVKMLLCGLLNIALAAVVPGLVPYLKWIGAAYLLYLAVHIIVAGRKQEKQEKQDDEQDGKKNLEATFWGGIMLQVLNIKSWIMGLTLFSVYVVPYTTQITDIVLWTGITCAIMIACTVIWSIVGHAIKRWYARYRLPFDIVFAALLLYSAVSAVL